MSRCYTTQNNNNAEQENNAMVKTNKLRSHGFRVINASEVV